MFLIATEGFKVHNLSDFACSLISALMAFLSVILFRFLFRLYFYSNFYFILIIFES